jgi:hypothetical protein
MTRTSAGVSRCGNIRGQDDWSSRAHVSCRCQAWNRLGDSRRIRRSARSGMHVRACSTARRICRLAPPSGSRCRDKVNPEARWTASTRAKQRRELLDASPEHEDLMPEFRVRAGGHVKTDDDRGRPAEPSACRRTGTPRSVARVTSPVR